MSGFIQNITGMFKNVNLLIPIWLDFTTLKMDKHLNENKIRKKGTEEEENRKRRRKKTRKTVKYEKFKKSKHNESN